MDLNCLQRKGISGFSRTRVNIIFLQMSQLFLFRVAFKPWPISVITIVSIVN